MRHTGSIAPSQTDESAFCGRLGRVLPVTVAILSVCLSSCSQIENDLWTSIAEKCDLPMTSPAIACMRMTLGDSQKLSQPLERVRLILPGEGTQGRVVRARRLPDDQRTDTWEGRIEGDEFSNLTISILGTAVAGEITTSTGDYYRVTGFADSAQLEQLSPFLSIDLLESESGPDKDACPLDPAPTGITCADTSDSLVDVLIVYTSQAIDRAGGSEPLLASLLVAERRTNRSFIQSGARSRIRVVRREFINYTESGSANEDLKRVASGSDGLEVVHELRHSTHADLVVLVVGGDDYRPTACPFPGSSLNKTAFATAAYAVVPVKSLLAFDLFTHELGHLFGAGHRSDGSGAFLESHAYQPGSQPGCGFWKSIMYRDGCNECGAILYWSNTKIKDCDGSPMGVLGKADNAHTIDTTSCTIATFGDQP